MLTTDYSEFLTPGVQVQLTVDEADALGLVEETALSETDAWDSNSDVIDADVGGAPLPANVIAIRRAAGFTSAEVRHG